VRERYQCAVIVVHHQPARTWTEAGSRKHGLARRVDATLFVDRLATGIVTHDAGRRARNLEAGLQLRFKPKQVVIDGDIERSGMVLELVQAVARQEPDTTWEKILVTIARAGSVSSAAELVDYTSRG